MRHCATGQRKILEDEKLRISSHSLVQQCQGRIKSKHGMLGTARPCPCHNSQHGKGLKNCVLIQTNGQLRGRLVARHLCSGLADVVLATIGGPVPGVNTYDKVQVASWQLLMTL